MRTVLLRIFVTTNSASFDACFEWQKRSNHSALWIPDNPDQFPIYPADHVAGAVGLLRDPHPLAGRDLPAHLSEFRAGDLKIIPLRGAFSQVLENQAA